MEEQRRFTDNQGEKLIRLEGEVNHIKDSVETIGGRLEEHIESNSRGFEELRNHMQSLAVSAQLQAQANVTQTITLKDLSATLIELSKSDVKLQSLEEFRVRTEVHLAACDAQHKSTEVDLTKTSEMVHRLYWIIPILVVVVGFVVEMLDTFHKAGVIP